MLLNKISSHAQNRLVESAPFNLRQAQRPPSGNDWLTWLILGGRGSGKTHAGSEWVHGLASGALPAAQAITEPIALIGETIADVREIMIEGPAGIRACAFYNRPHYEATRRRLVWPNGAVAHVYSAHDPESLRGPQFAAAWCDELAKWPYAQECWDMLQFGLRLGDWPRQLVTTTPKNIGVLKKLIALKSTRVTHMPTKENASNLAASFLLQMQERYGGTRLGRQELDGELIESREDALWSRENIEEHRVFEAPDLLRIIVAVDPPASSKITSDACGIIVAGIDARNHAYVLADRTMKAVKPHQWAARAIAEYHAWQADVLLAEVNQGGEMVSSVIAAIDASVPVKSVHASRGKYLRAEPVAALYEQGRVHHVGGLQQLEDEMCDFALEGLTTGKSPDRMDACVWAITELLMRNSSKPRIRSLATG